VKLYTIRVGIDPHDGQRYWLTPAELYAELDAEFHFDFDPCPYPRDPKFDGLLVEWGSSNFVNPPTHNGLDTWVSKAILEHRMGKKIVFLTEAYERAPILLLAEGAGVRPLKVGNYDLTLYIVGYPGAK
jgi:hypothetical protein